MISQLHCPGIGKNANDCMFVSVCALYDESAAAYAGKTRLKMSA